MKLNRKLALLLSVVFVVSSTLTLSVMSVSVSALDELVTTTDKVTLPSKNQWHNGGFESESVGTEKALSWMMDIAGKFEVIEDNSLAIEGKKLIKAKSEQDVRVAIPELKAGYRINISYYYKSTSASGMWSKLKDIDNKETAITLTGVNGFTDATFSNGWHKVTDTVRVGQPGSSDIVPGKYHFAMGCFGNGGEVYIDALSLIILDSNGKELEPGSFDSNSDSNASKKTATIKFSKKKATVKAKKSITLKVKNAGSSKLVFSVSNKKLLKIVKKSKASVTVKGLKKGKAKVIATIKGSTTKAACFVTVKK